ncbi:hypothetical protein CALCODRAFT_505168 [Calocera cornea HHB12733]|uniref:Uncharacterized protein n=1 Tax=Calocera cornea HHB12733 TaxID=1353952 RepID=A0A165AMZ1_9BASI|nr:hypothetical protein CALCODRAFT_505168 [Calocera cornea HHB12733]
MPSSKQYYIRLRRVLRKYPFLYQYKGKGKFLRSGSYLYPKYLVLAARLGGLGPFPWKGIKVPGRHPAQPEPSPMEEIEEKVDDMLLTIQQELETSITELMEVARYNIFPALREIVEQSARA